MTIRKTTLRVAAIAIFAAIAALVGVLILQVSKPQYEGFDAGEPPILREDYERQEAGNLAIARNKGNDKVALRVNGYPVTVADVLEAQAHRRNILAYQRQFARRIVPDDHPGPFYSGLSDDYSPFTDGVTLFTESEMPGVKERLALSEKYGVDTAALAKIIFEYATLTAAIAEGFGITDAELERYLDEWRTQAEHFPLSYFSEAEYRKGVGERAYWNDITPARLYSYYTVLAWRKHHLGKITDHDEHSRMRSELEAIAYTNADVEFTKHYELDATVEDAVAFILENSALMQKK